MGGREVPIHLELNSVASRASRAAIHPAAGSCRSLGDATGGLAPTATLGKGENTRAWTDTRGVGVRTAPGFSLRVVPMACWGGGFLATAGVRAVHGGALPGGGAGIPCPWPWPDTGQDTRLRALHFPGSCRSRGGCGSREGDVRSWLARSQWKTREPRIGPRRILPWEAACPVPDAHRLYSSILLAQLLRSQPAAFYYL